MAVLPAALVILPLQAHAQATSTVVGTVTATENGEPLPGANVSIPTLQLGTTTDLEGRYSLLVDPGTYELQVSFVGFRTATATITLTPGGTTTQDFQIQEDLVGAGEVVVIGTRRQGRTVVDSPVPIDVLTPAEIQSTGLAETTQILQLLVPSYNAPQASITDGSDHVRPATLRGLGPDQVLVLINGKRRHTSALVHVNGSVGRGSTGVDLNAIPASAIERIEVLRDGAAAQYGSDAIAGVINVVLKEREGLDASVTYGQYLSSVERGYEPQEALLPGGSDADAYDWDAQGEPGTAFIGTPETVTYSDGETVNAHLGYGFDVGRGGTVYVSGQLRHRGYVNRAGLDPRQQYFTEEDGSMDPREEDFDRLNHRYGNGRFNDLSLFVNGSVPINEAGTQFYADGGFSARDGLSGCFYRRANDNRTVRAIYPNGFLPKINAKVKDFSASAGFKGNAGGWAYDLSETFGNNGFTFDITDSHNASLGTQPQQQEAFDSGTLRFAQATTNLDLFRSVEIGTAAPLSVAIGGEFRWDNYRIDAGEQASYIDGGVPVLDGPNAGASAAPGAQCFPGFAPNSTQNESRTNFGVYVDLENNLTSAVLLSAAGRFENYSDFGSTLTGKFAARAELTPVLALRGAISTGFRAPSLAQAWFTSVATNFIDGVPFEVGTFPVESDVALALGAQNLEAEKSRNYSAGITLSPENLSVTIDGYLIEIDDRITFTENFTDPAVAEFLNNQGINATGGRYFTNALDTRTRGLDVIARYGVFAGSGSVRFTAAANFTDTEVTNKNADGVIAAPPELQALNQPTLVGRDRIGDFEDAQPKNKINLQVNYDVNAWRFMARANRYGEVTAVSTDPLRDQTFSARWLTDVEVGYRLASGLNLAVGANNLFDVYPEKQLKANSFNGIFPYNGFSPFGFFGRYLYSRLSYQM